jgi:tetratricopeptide (TPR) repeat protein
MDRIKNARHTVFICVLLGAITLAAYWPVFHSDFVNLDDHDYVTENPHVLNGLSREDVSWAFGTGYAGNWHPLTWLSHMLDVQLFGLKPAWHHGVNLLFHIANSLLLFLLLKRMTGTQWRSAFVAFLFALHPLHVESVAWVAERKDVLSTFFFMLTLLAYAKYVEEKAESRKQKAETVEHGGRFQLSAFSFQLSAWYGLALALLALGLISKPMLVTLPFVLLLLDFWPLARFQPSTQTLQLKTLVLFCREKIPFFLVAAASSVVTFLVQQGGKAVSTTEALPISLRAANAAVSYLKYLGKTIWPVDLAVFYPYPGTHGTGSQPDWQIAGAVLVLTVVSASAIVRWKRKPWLATGWFWYLGTLAPVIGLVQVGTQAMADRYSYIPLIGVFICFVWGAANVFTGRRWGAVALTVVGIATVVVCGALAQNQAKYWRDDFALFEHALAVTTNNAPAHFNLGTALGRQGKYNEALTQFQAALEIDPFSADTHYNSGLTLASLGKMEAAAEEYRAALRLRSDHARARCNLGTVLWSLGRRDEALDQFAEALRLKPDCLEAHYGLGVVLAAGGSFAQAETHLAEAIRLKPDLAEAYTRLAEVLVKQGRQVEAEAQLREVIRLHPANAGAHINLAQMLLRAGQQDEALAQYAEALRLEPNRPELDYQMGALLLEQGKAAEAAFHLAQAVRLKPDSFAAQACLGRALAVEGKLVEAQAKFRDTIRLCPTNARVRVDLGNSLMIAGQTNEAAACYADALRLNPDLAQEYLQSGKTLADKGETSPALASFMTAAWLQPDNADAQENLGLLLARQGKTEEAAIHFEAGLRLRPDAQAHYNLGLARLVQGRPAEALAHYQQAIALKPDWVDALNDLAWLLATNPRAELRNGPEAVRLAERACQASGGKEARFWGTLDAAYAEAGRFDEAITTATKTRASALAAGQSDVARAAEQRLALYRQHLPYRQ